MKNLSLCCSYAVLLGILLAGCSRALKPFHAYPHTTGFITVADSRLYYETTGAGPDLVLLHGGLLDSRMWTPQVAAFARDYRVITIDQRGHGRTVDGDSSYFMHEALRMLMDSLYVRRAVVGGLSMGAMVATDFAIEYPAYTDKLILLVPGLSGNWKIIPEDSIMEQRFAHMKQALVEQHDTLLAAEHFIRNWFDGPLRRPEETDTLQRRRAVEMAYATMRMHKSQHWVRAAEPESIHRLGKILCPTLIVVAEKDNPIIRRNADILLRDIPQAKKVLIGEVAHMPNMERPEAVNRAIAAFLKQ